MIISIDPTKTPETGRTTVGQPISTLLTNFRELGGKLPTHSVKLAALPHAQNVAYHANFMNYVLACWGGHHGVVIRPDIIWFELLCELASLVAEHPDRFRHLFTKEAEGKQLIMIQTATPHLIPLDELMERLKELVPCDSAPFLPQFSTAGKASRFAHYAAFADMASPYYNYATFLCGIPKIIVAGTEQDWDLMGKSWDLIYKLMKPEPGSEEDLWFARVDAILAGISIHLEDGSPSAESTQRFWSGFFTAEKCGSGHEFAINGWMTSLYRTEPEGVRKPENFLPHQAVVNYTDLSGGTEYSMRVGVFCSLLDEDNFLSPNFGTVVLEKLHPKI